MKKRNYFITAILLALAALLPTTGMASAAGQHITFALHSIPDSVDPGITPETYSAVILYNLFEGLLTYDAQNNIIPGQAEKWELSDDGLVYTFHLRDGLKWSDGTPLTAEDFRYSWLRVITPATGSLYTDQLLPYVVGAQEFFDGKIGEEGVGIKAVDKNTLTVTLKSPTPFFLGLLSTNTFFPVQKATVEANKDKWTLSAETYVSNGPFKTAKIKFNESYEFVRNEHYWNAKNVKLDRLTFIYILDTSTALTAFRAREIDGFWEAPASDLPTLRAESDELITVKAFGTTFHLMNNSVPPFDNVLVRKAFNLAIDRRALIEDVLGTNDSPAYSLVAPGYVVNGVDVTEWRSSYGMSPEARPEAAKAALAEAGYPDGEGFPEIVYYYSTNDTYKKTVEALSAMLKANLNIGITLKTVDWAVFYADIQAGKYQIGQYGWGGDYLHPMTFLPLMITNGVNNFSNYSNPEYDALVAEIQRATDQKRAAELVRKAEDTMMKDYPILPLFHRSYSYMMRKGTAGYFRTPLNNLYFRDAYVTD
ncbi:MAG: peptide ABC transporter substrate-binding protein [Synergistaceae bacterium]|nr:peptide ABC transporter substrate-binding protein [Synergistaceae bacterium]